MADPKVKATEDRVERQRTGPLVTSSEAPDPAPRGSERPSAYSKAACTSASFTHNVNIF